jgi:uncharacterized protein YegL
MMIIAVPFVVYSNFFPKTGTEQIAETQMGAAMLKGQDCIILQ